MAAVNVPQSNVNRVRSSGPNRQNALSVMRVQAAGDDARGDRRVSLVANAKPSPQLGRGQPVKSERKSWGPILARMQRMYDKGWFKKRLPRRIYQLWDVALKVRKGLESQGFSQELLRLKRNALLAEGVIYAIWSPRCERVYVGQTSSSAFHRFQQHVWKANKGSTLPLHRAMVAIGYDHFSVFPLEKVHYSYRNRSDRRKKFEQAATPRERYWIERLHTYSPRGFNLEYSGRRRHRPHRQHNPMKRHRACEGRIEVATAVEQEAGMPSLQGRWYASRDFLRRCKYLVDQYEAETLDRVDSRKYSKKNLWKMLNAMESGAHEFAAPAAKAVTNWLRAAVMLRQPGTSAKEPRCASVIRVTWNNRLLRQVPLRDVVMKYRHLLRDPQFLEDVLIVRKLEKPLGSSMFNYTKTSRELEAHASLQCDCHRLFPAKFRNAEGCVLTGDLSLVKHRELRTLMSYGPNFRTHVEADPMDAVKEALEDFIERRCADGISQRSDFLPWKVEVLEECKRMLSNRVGHTGPKVTVSFSARKYLRFLQHHLVLVPVDKAANNIAFVCKAYYCKVLLNELSREGGAYEDVNRNVDDILAEHKRYLEPKRFEATPKTAYLYWLPKLHKNPVGQRFIAGSANCSTTQLSSLLSDALSLVLKTLREKDNRHIVTGGSRRFFVVGGYEEVASYLSGGFQARMGTRLYTGDFSTMYTTIPHDDLLDRVKRVCKEAWEWLADEKGIDMNNLAIKCTGLGAEWWKPKGLNMPRVMHSKASHILSFDELSDFVSFLVKNSFLVNGGVCKRQVCGIPMGTNCAPALANLYMYSYESEYIDGNPGEAHAFHSTFRLIDDVLSIDNSHWEHAISLSYEEGGLYPSCLQMNDTSVSPTVVNFLGMQLTLIGGHIDLDVYDKRDAFTFAVNRYPHMHSLIPSSIPYGVFVGLVHRYYRICSTQQSFVRQCANLARILVKQGCAMKRLRSRLFQFLDKRPRAKWNNASKQLFYLFKKMTGDL